MTVLMRWAAPVVLLFGLAGGVQAEMTVSQSNDPDGSIDVHMTALLGQERAALSTLTSSDVAAIATAPMKPGKSKGKAVMSYDGTWLAALPRPESSDELDCLAQALYFEARGESIKGQAAVAEVILNRVDSPSFPKTVCAVVNQGGNGGCQFSYTCDGRAEVVAEPEAWKRSAKIAGAMLDGAPRILTEGATYFHTPQVSPSWSKRFELTATIGAHLFYRAPIVTALN
ncbi:cell wall hydrolase [Defluviimonas sp. WL0002]|uniref:Cell wall hydrolase n=1 Tax=Albidovulum marisflavi TaxID=2984159 RepID=A0ABT2ZAI9_9RHOB|nr:cell wall hydrolase [Defluviimonas sp. WL0002]MCV2868153.1 cell wall hydrolase [Defluviimonas sp. WL0002]